MGSSITTINAWNEAVKDADEPFYNEIVNGELIACYADGETLVIPDGVEVIKEDAFSWQRIPERYIRPTVRAAIDSEGMRQYISEIFIPASVRKIEGGAFYNVEGLSEIHIHPNNKQFVVRNNALMTSDGTTFIYMPLGDAPLFEKYSVPYGVKSIVNNAFNCGIGELVLPSTVERLGGALFMAGQCDKMNLPDSIREIGKNLFLGEVSNEPGAYIIGANNKVLVKNEIGIFTRDGRRLIRAFDTSPNLIRIPDGVEICDCMAFKDVYCRELIIPGSMKEIEDDAFYDTGFKKIMLMDGVASIGKRAFFFCEYLEDIYIPASVKHIAEDAFENCDDVVIHAPKGSYALDFAEENGLEYEPYGSTILMESPITAIEEWNEAVKDAVSMQNAKIVSKELIKCDFFCVAKNGEWMICPNVIEKLLIPDNVETIQKHAISSPQSINEIFIPASVKAIDGGAFLNVQDLKQIHIHPDNKFLVMRDNALLSSDGTSFIFLLHNDETDNKYVIPDGVKSIEDFAFGHRIDELVLPDTVERLGRGLRCGKLHLPDNITCVYDGAFSEMPYTAEAFDIGGNSTLLKNEFGIFTKDGSRLLLAFDNELDVIRIPDGVVSCDRAAFKSVDGKTLIIPASMRHIAAKTFAYSHFKTIILSDGVRSIGAKAFAYCQDMENIKIPASVRDIEEDAFYCAYGTISAPAGSYALDFAEDKALDCNIDEGDIEEDDDEDLEEDFEEALEEALKEALEEDDDPNEL